MGRAAAQTVNCLRDHDLDLAGADVGEQTLIFGPIKFSAADFGVCVNFGLGPPLTGNVIFANPSLIIDRRAALSIG
jgi:hypothetical protein